MPRALAQARGLAEAPALPVSFALDRIAGPAPAFLTRAGDGARLAACTGTIYIDAQIPRMLDDALSHLPCTASPTRTA
jgi:hypothetical protein